MRHGQKISLQGVWRGKRKQQQSKTKLSKVSLYRVSIICLHFAHTQFNQCVGEPGSLPMGMRILTICLKCNQKLQLNRQSTFFPSFAGGGAFFPKKRLQPLTAAHTSVAWETKRGYGCSNQDSGFTPCLLSLAGCKAPTELSHQDVLAQACRVFPPQAQPTASSCHSRHLFGRIQGCSNWCPYYPGNYGGNGPGSIHISLSTHTYEMPSTVQPSMGWNRMGGSSVHQELGITCTSGLTGAFSTPPPHSSIPIILLIKTTSQMTGHVSVLKTVPTTSVQRHTSQWRSPVWHYPEKRKCAFLHWTPGQRGVGSSSWLKIFTFPKRWQSTLYCTLLSSESKGEADWKDDFWLDKDIFLGRTKTTTTHPHIFWIITV